MGFWEEFAEWANKPASMAAGFSTGASKMLGRLTGGDDDPQNLLGYSNPLSGLVEGAKRNLSYAEASRALQGKYEPNTAGSKWIGAGLDTLADPTMLIGGGGAALKGIKGLAETEKLGSGVARAVAASKLAGKAEPYLAAAGEIGPLKGAPLGEKAAQLGRRVVTGTAMTGNPLAGLGYATMAEPLLGRAARSQTMAGLLSKLPRRTATVTAEDLGEEVGKAARPTAPTAPAEPNVPGTPKMKKKEFQAAIDRVMGGNPAATADEAFAANIDRMVGAPSAMRTPTVPTDADINEVLGGLAGEPFLGSSRLAQPVPTINPELPQLTLEDLMDDPSIAHYRGIVKRNAAMKLLQQLEGAA